VWEKVSIRIRTPAAVALTRKSVGLSRAIQLQNERMVDMDDGGALTCVERESNESVNWRTWKGVCDISARASLF
jgi:hypothetical protein